MSSSLKWGSFIVFFIPERLPNQNYICISCLTYPSQNSILKFVIYQNNFLRGQEKDQIDIVLSALTTEITVTICRQGKIVKI